MCRVSHTDLSNAPALCASIITFVLSHVLAPQRFCRLPALNPTLPHSRAVLHAALSNLGSAPGLGCDAATGREQLFAYGGYGPWWYYFTDELKVRRRLSNAFLH